MTRPFTRVEPSQSARVCLKSYACEHRFVWQNMWVPKGTPLVYQFSHIYAAITPCSFSMSDCETKLKKKNQKIQNHGTHSLKYTYFWSPNIESIKNNEVYITKKENNIAIMAFRAEWNHAQTIVPMGCLRATN